MRSAATSTAGPPLWADPSNSLLPAAFEAGVPVYTSSPGDSSIGMNLAALRLGGGKLQIDTLRDVNETAAIVYRAKQDGGQSGVLILGGGSPKNFILQTEPQIQEVLGLAESGHDYFLQVTDARPDTGGLSGATAHEAMTWGKVDPEMLPDSVTCYTDTTIALPLLTAYALARREPRPLRRLYDRREADYEALRAAYVAQQGAGEHAHRHGLAILPRQAPPCPAAPPGFSRSIAMTRTIRPSTRPRGSYARAASSRSRTETVYGLGADATNPEAVGRNLRGQGPPGDESPDRPRRGCRRGRGRASPTGRNPPKSSPKPSGRGPLTIVLPALDDHPESVTAGLDTVGVRVPLPVEIAKALDPRGPPDRRAQRQSLEPASRRRPPPTSLKDLDGRIDLILDSGPRRSASNRRCST